MKKILAFALFMFSTLSFADSKGTALTRTTSLLESDLVYCVHYSGATPNSRAATMTTMTSYMETNLAVDLLTGGTQLTHEKGGLEADASAFSGFLKILAGVTSAVSSGTSSGNVCLYSDDGTLQATTLERVSTETGIAINYRCNWYDDGYQCPGNVSARSTPPATPLAHDFYLDDGTNTASTNHGWRWYDGADWQDLGGTSGSGGGGEWGTSSELTISASSITPTGTTHIHTVDTQGDAALDGINTIVADNMSAGDMLLLMPENTARTVWITNDDNIDTPDDRHYPIPHNTGAILEYDGSNWRLLTCGNWGLTENHTVYFNSSQNATTINGIITSMPIYRNGFLLKFSFGDGTYTLDDDLKFEDMYDGNTQIWGNSADTLPYNPGVDDPSVILDFSATNTHGIIIADNVATVDIRYLHIKWDSANGKSAIYFSGYSPYIRIRYLVCEGNDGTSASGYGINVFYNKGEIKNCWFTSTAYCISIYEGANFLSSTNNDYAGGTQPKYGLAVGNNAHIGKGDATQPDGSTSNETGSGSTGSVIE